MRDVVIKHHPEFVKSTDLQSYGLRHPTLFNIERLIEESLAAVGGYKFVDEEGYDFDDKCKSDSKTVSVVSNSPTTKVFIIQNVHTKIGSLRVTIYNPFKDSVDYMYLPKKAVRYWKENNGTLCNEAGAKERIRCSWSAKHNHYNKLEDYRVKDFVALATAMT